MRLYLSSYGLGNYPKELIKLIGHNKNVAVIGNAGDNFGNKKERREKIKKQITSLSEIGLIPREIDLRKYFGKEKELENKLKKLGAVWIRGGNTFILRKAMKLSGFDKIIKKMLKKDEIVYAGYSAAWCILSRSLHGLDIVDNPKDIVIGYPKKVIWSGLGLINYMACPHYKSDHPESTGGKKEIAYYKKNKIPYKTLRDGEVIVINGNKEKVFRNKK
jgi:dipeptidase E